MAAGTIVKIKVINESRNYIRMYREGMLILDYTDTKLDNQCIERKIKQNTYIYRKNNNEYILENYKIPKSTKFIKSKKSRIK